MIPQEIINLVNLALRDGILTYREREAITREAIGRGVGEAEIKEYLDNALAESIGRIPRENLKRCPGCGGQVPLVADTCLFCGYQLGTSSKVYRTDGYAGDSDAVRIINQENARTVMEGDGDISNCPDCGAPLPLISNICEHCGHIVKERSNSQYNINNLIETVNQNLRNMDKCRVSFADAIKDKLFAILLIIMALVFIVGFSHADGMDQPPVPLVILILLLGTGAIWVRKKFGESVVERADQNFFRSKAVFEQCRRHTDTIYGNSREAQDLIAKFDEAISGVDRQRKSNRNKILLMVSAAIAIPFLATSQYGDSQQNYQNMRHQLADRFQLIETEVVIPHGFISELGSLSTDYVESDSFSPYLQVADNAVLTATMTSADGILLLTGDGREARLKLSNLLLRSTGKAFPGSATSQRLEVLLLDSDRQIVDVLEEEFLHDSEAQIPNRLPDGKVLSYRTLLNDAGHSCMATFVSKESQPIANSSSLIDKINRTKSFVLVLK